ncbi:MAG: ATP-grasp domain-containing protein [Clostridia bacterium]|nr:ATP-grasp domain-containing protein [Clostridia bacterium]
MEIKEKEFMAVLLGSDINTYSMARAFHEAYQIKSKVIGKFYTGPSYQSKIIDFYARPDIDQKEIFVKELNDFATQHTDKKLILLGCGDNYVRQIIENKNELDPNYIIPYIDQDLMETLIKKEAFYEMCEKHGISYPKTFIYRQEMGNNFTVDFGFPMILKPSNSVDYFAHEFPTQNKVYTIKSREELEQVIHDIYEAGYSDTLILQDFIPGDDTYMHVMTCYSDQNGKVKLMCLGHTMLEEHTPHGIGNHAVIINEHNEALANQLKEFLESIHYVGFSNFDIKYDERNGTYNVFEINLRQGRSNFYVTGAGYNLAKYLVEDVIYGNDTGFTIANKEHLWSMIPLKIAYTYVKNPEYVQKMRALVKSKQFVNPLFYKGDNHFIRFLKLKRRQFRQFGNFKKYLGK